jgi:hypothetical protein
MDKLFDALKVYGTLLVDKETAANVTIITQDPTESDFVKGFNRGELFAYHNAYLHFKLMLDGLTRA